MGNTGKGHDIRHPGHSRGQRFAGPNNLSLNPSSAPYCLCDLGQVTHPLCASFSSSVQRDNTTYLRDGWEH